MNYNIVEILGYIFGAGGMFSIFAYFKQNKQLKIKEVELADVNVKLAAANVKLTDATAETSIVENYEKLVDRLESTITSQDERIEKIESFHERRYQELSKQLDINTTKIKELSKKINANKPFICYDLNCKVRKNKR